MMRLPRLLPAVLLSAALISPLSYSSWMFAEDMQPEGAPAETEGAPAADEAAPSKAAPEKATTEAPAAEAPAADASAADATDSPLKQSVEDFWHYAKTARYDLAINNAGKVIAKSENPLAVLEAFEAVSAERKDSLDDWLLRWQGVDALKDPVNQIVAILNKGRLERINDPKYIGENIAGLSRGARAFELSKGRLRNSGEAGVAMMVDALLDPARRSEHAAIRRALTSLGKEALNPLLVATQMKDWDVLIPLLGVLADIEYRESIPFLAILEQSKDVPSTVNQAAGAALVRMGGSAGVNPATEFYTLAEAFYYDKSALIADTRQPLATVWDWDDNKHLVRKSVSPQIFNEVQALRAAEKTLQLDPSNTDAIALWLSANYKKEAELPAGGTDESKAEGAGSAHYYGVEAGAKYLDLALTRALRDDNASVALGVIRSLQAIVGPANLSTSADNPLVQAMSSRDRQVRFEAAYALGSALPDKPFAGQEQVVPLLAEAITQVGKTNVLVVLPSTDAVNAMVDGLKQAGYGAVGGASAEAALAQAGTLPAVDVVLTSEALGGAELTKLVNTMATSPRLAGAAKVIITPSPASPYAKDAAVDRSITVTQVTEPAGLQTVIEAARTKGGSLAIDEKQAETMALRSSDLLTKLAMGRGQVLDLTAAKQTLLAALEDARPEVTRAVAGVLGYLNVPEAQTALLTRASVVDLAPEVRISLYKGLSTNARFTGNQLTADQVTTLLTTVTDEPNVEVRSAAAEAYGALNLPPEQVKKLIVAGK